MPRWSKDKPNAAAGDVRQSFSRLERIGTKSEEPKNDLISMPGSASQCVGMLTGAPENSEGG